MQVVPEKLNVRDRGGRYASIREMAGEEDKGDIADVLMRLETRYVLDFEGRIAIRI